MSSIAELSSLTGRVALITGGAGHIGGAIGDALEAHGARVMVADLKARSEDSVPGGRTHLPVDLSDPVATRGLVRDVIASAGRLDILIHAAAYVGTSDLPGWNVPFDQQSVEAWDAALRVNVTAAFALAQASREFLARGGKGSIVFISSIYGSVAPDFTLYDGTTMGNPAAYGTSKAALVQLARYLSALFAPAIRVNVLTPGGVWRDQPSAFVERYVARTPLRRMATEEDLKGPAVFLASDLSAYVTGHELVVDGGWTAR
jgi:NAD(P)-dependent dehydrogenase (short-subunit alcohol dehydrogenase family)